MQEQAVRQHEVYSTFLDPLGRLIHEWRLDASIDLTYLVLRQDFTAKALVDRHDALLVAIFSDAQLSPLCRSELPMRSLTLPVHQPASRVFAFAGLRLSPIRQADYSASSRRGKSCKCMTRRSVQKLVTGISVSQGNHQSKIGSSR